MSQDRARLVFFDYIIDYPRDKRRMYLNQVVTAPGNGEASKLIHDRYVGAVIEAVTLLDKPEEKSCVYRVWYMRQSNRRITRQEIYIDTQKTVANSGDIEALETEIAAKVAADAVLIITLSLVK